MEPRISIVTLCVTDLGRSRHFYEQLGWKTSSASTDGIVFFQAGGMALALYPRASLAGENAGLSDDISGFGGTTLAYNTRSKADVDAVLAEAKAVGANILKPAEEVFWGGYSGYFEDPDGFVWEVAFNPFISIAEDGSIALPD
jgi:predicted lactoylglutathione lyase